MNRNSKTISSLLCVMVLMAASGAFAQSNINCGGAIVSYAWLHPFQFKPRMDAMSVAYLPVGSLEWHGEHLPLGVDGLRTVGVCERAAQQGGGIVVPPTYWGTGTMQGWDPTYGFTNGSGVYDTRRVTFTNMIIQVIDNLDRLRFHAIVMVAGNHPSEQTNALDIIARQYQPKFGAKLLFLTDQDLAPSMGTDHGGKYETSIMLYLNPELVETNRLAASGSLYGVVGQDPRTTASAAFGGQVVSQMVDTVVSKAQALIFGAAPSTWTAYNDCGWTANSLQSPSANDVTGNFTTNSPTAQLSGNLMDTNGASLQASVTFTTGSAAGMNLLDRTIAPPVGSDAANWFGGKVGTNCAVNWTSGSVGMTLTGLDTGKTYNIVLWSTRGLDSAAYSNRFTEITISGVGSFANLSSAGTEISTASSPNDRTRVRASLASGVVARYDAVVPANNGTVTFNMAADADLLWPSAGASTNGYLNAFAVMTSTNVPSTNAPPPAVATNMVAMGASWQYFSTGNLPATNWYAKGFSDGSWSGGPAPLGYADPAILTTLPYGGVDTNKWITYYFRKHFTVTNTASVTGLVADFIADDGAVIYLNGAKVFTSTNMIEPVDNTSLTTVVEPEPYVAKTFTIAPSGLSTGDNVLAVEVHQNGPGSSDIYFDLALNAVSFTTTNQPGGGQQGASNAPPASVTNWTAYNDTAWHQDPNIFPASPGIDVTASAFTTNSPIGSVNGALKATTGQALPVTVSFSGSPAVAMLARDLAIPAGTDLDALFGGKIGTNNIANWTNGTVTMTLSGLTTTKQYTVAIWSSRGGTSASYSNRWTDITIKSVDSFANNSSAGLTKLTSAMANDETRVVSVIDNGRLARYDQVRPGADGTIVFDMAANGLTASDVNGYLNAFMVTEGNVTVGSPGDADSDGMPDSWEQSNFGSTSAANGGPMQDFDGDGVPNLLEFIAGTSPTSGNSHPMMDHPALTNGSVMFDLPTTTGRIYSIDYRSNLTASAWLNYTSFLGSGSTTVVTNNRPDSHLYYRFRIRMQNP